jgi:predicted amidohydrolase
VRLLLAALRCEKGDPTANLAAHAALLRSASEAGCRLAVFPEMSLSGSVNPATHPERLLTLDSPQVLDLAALTGVHGVGAVFGVAESGAHITQVFADRGRVVGVYRKRHLGEGEEAFTPGTLPAVFRVDDVPFGVAICAEARVDYPFDEPAAAGARLILFSAAPGLYGPRRVDDEAWRAGFEWWESYGLDDARQHAVRTATWVAMTTQAGSTVDEDFPGIAALIAPDGSVVSRLPDWREGTLIVDVPALNADV